MKWKYKNNYWYYAQKILKVTKMNYWAYRVLKVKLSRRTNIDLGTAYKLLNIESVNPDNSCYSENSINTCCHNYDLTIIVPAYNVQLFIKTCLDSIIEQKTSYRYNIIVVNDGSTDNTSKILDNYLCYDNLRVINQENKGFSGARNTALKYVESPYIMFVDSDDILEKDAIESLLKKAYGTDADIVEGGHVSFDKTVVGIVNYEERELEGYKGLRGEPWGKVIKSQFFDKLKFPENYWFEDTIMTMIIYPQAKSIHTISNVVYRYRLNANGISANARHYSKALDTVWITDKLIRERKDVFKLHENKMYHDSLLEQIILNYNRTRFLPGNIKEAVFAIAVNWYREVCDIDQSDDMPHIDLKNALCNCDYGVYQLYCELL